MTPAPNPVPLFDMQARLRPLRQELVSAYERCLDHGAFCLGPEVEALEGAFARQFGFRHALGFNSGTSALHAAVLALGIGRGDEVITTPLTFIASSWAIVYAGATPRFVDVDAGTLTLDARRLDAAVSPRTKAVLPVHLYGQCCDLAAITRWCERHRLSLIEDAAQAHGATYDGRSAGSFGRVAIFSFYPGKNLGAVGEGGMLVTADDPVAQAARLLRNHGASNRYRHELIGYNYRMEAVQAAALGVMLPHLEQWNQARRRAARLYRDLLADTPLTLTTEDPRSLHAYHLFVVRHPRRDELREHLEKQGIGAGLHYPLPLHLQPCFQHLGYHEGDFPVAEAAARECLSLPMFPEISAAQITRVCTAVRGFFRP